MDELEELIRRGWGDTPQNEIPPDWRDYENREDHPSQKIDPEARNWRLMDQAKARNHSRREAAALSAMLRHEPMIVTDPGGARKRYGPRPDEKRSRAEKIMQHAAEMRYQYTLLRYTRKVRRKS